MLEVEQLIYARMIADTDAVSGLVTILGGTSHILHAFENIIPTVPALTFQVFSSVHGQLGGNYQRSVEVFIQFNIFANNYGPIATRLRQLFDGYRFDVPTNYVEVGQCRGLYDTDNADAYDEVLETKLKQVRYRFFVTPKAWNPITA